MNDKDKDPDLDVLEHIAQGVGEIAREHTSLRRRVDELDKRDRGARAALDFRARKRGGTYGNGSQIDFNGSDAGAVAKDILGVPGSRFEDYGAIAGNNLPSDALEARTLWAEWTKLATKAQLRAYAPDHPALFAKLAAIRDLDIREKTALAGQTDASGGYTVPNVVANEVLKIIRDASLIYGRARQVVMTSDTLNFPNENTAVTINWSKTDGTTLTGGEPVFGQSQLLAYKLIGRATFSLELLDDANVAILPFLQACFAEKFGGELDFQAMEGPGTATSPFTGVLNATSVNDAARTNGTNGVVLTYNSTASTKASLVQIYTAATESQPRNDGVWVCGPAVYAQIIGLVDSNGQPIVRFGDVTSAIPGTLLGRPIVVSARLPKTTVGAGTVSVGSLYFGPPNALLFGNRMGMRWDVTDQVSWSTYQGDARMVGRFGYVVGVPTAWVKQTGIIV
jgi:HK97 family phage major capsid protein